MATTITASSRTDRLSPNVGQATASMAGARHWTCEVVARPWWRCRSVRHSMLSRWSRVHTHCSGPTDLRRGPSLDW